MSIPLSFITLSLLLSMQAVAQVNTEKLRSSDSGRGLAVSVSAATGLVRGNSEYFSFTASGRSDLMLDESYHFLVASYDMRESGEGKISNKGFAHLRTMWNVRKNLILEGFTQLQYDQFILLKQRTLAGSGVRLGIPLAGDSSGGDALQIFVGVGAMYEHELYGADERDVVFHRLRSTNYLSLIYSLDTRVTLSTVAYAQPLFDEPANHRFVLEASVMVRLTTFLALHVDVAWNYNSHPVGNIRRYDLELSNGVSLTIR
ncbi:MAG: DUF481 domain-containing protein [Bacteroidia bacterium]|nr:DUF481 domain-containing protein [Bacteroidia bacterium]